MLLVEMWTEALYRAIFFDALLTDLSKAFDCISHFLMIAKLDVYGFDNNACTLILNYLSNRKQRVKIGNCYSRSTKISKGVPQGSILGPLLFNIYIYAIYFTFLIIMLQVMPMTQPHSQSANLFKKLKKS